MVRVESDRLAGTSMLEFNQIGGHQSGKCNTNRWAPVWLELNQTGSHQYGKCNSNRWALVYLELNQAGSTGRVREGSTNMVRVTPTGGHHYS